MQPRIQKILEGITRTQRIAGAYIFSGPPGAGKKEAAAEFTRLLECKEQDIFNIVPDGASLKIDQIRELQSWVRFGPSAGAYLTAIIEGADTLTDEAAGAFLKTLEEPPPGVVFILIVEREDRLPDTIHSRCQRIVFPETMEEWTPSPEFSSFHEELKKIKGAPLLALFQFSARLEKEKEKLEEILYDLVHCARHELADTHCARVILDTVRFLKRRANVKLALDVMCLKMAEGR